MAGRSSGPTGSEGVEGREFPGVRSTSPAMDARELSVESDDADVEGVTDRSRDVWSRVGAGSVTFGEGYRGGRSWAGIGVNVVSLGSGTLRISCISGLVTTSLTRRLASSASDEISWQCSSQVAASSGVANGRDVL